MKTKALLLSSLLWFSASYAVEFEKSAIELGGRTLKVELAKTYEQQARGLMFRKSLKDDEGMLFVYTGEAIRSFWMKNTFVPLSIGFFNAKKELVDIQDMEPVVSEMQTDIPSYISRDRAMYALEVPRGWFQRHGVKLKARFKFVNGEK